MEQKDVLTGAIVFAGVTLFAIAGVVGLTLYHAWALVTLWKWFAVPTFGLPVISYVQAIGVSLIVSLFTPKNFVDQTKGMTNVEKFQAIFTALLGPAYVVFMGWIIKGWM